MNEELNTYNLMELLCDLNTEDSFNVLHNPLVGAFDVYMPEKTKRVSNKICKHEPWITKGIMNSIVKQKQLYKRTYSKSMTLLYLRNAKCTERHYKGKLKHIIIGVDVRSSKMIQGNYGT